MSQDVLLRSRNSGFINLIRETGPPIDQASYAMGNGSIPRVMPPKRGVDHPLTSSAEVKERLELYLYSPSGPSWLLLGWNLLLLLPHTY